MAPLDGATIDELLALLPERVFWPDKGSAARADWFAGTALILCWLAEHPGSGWQAAGADDGHGWLDRWGATRGRGQAQRRRACCGVTALLLGRVVLPGYGFLNGVKIREILQRTRQVHSVEAFARVEAAATGRGMHSRGLERPLTLLAKLVLHTGRGLDELRDTDFAAYREFGMTRTGRPPHGLLTAWDLMVEATGLQGRPPARHGRVRVGQRSVAELVDRYPIAARPIRDLLVRYLQERQPALDHSSLIKLSTTLAKTFWCDLEAHHPGICDLRLDRDIVRAWIARLDQDVMPSGQTRSRLGRLHLLVDVRAFYLDLAEWATHDPSWAAWAVPSPILRSDIAGQQKNRAATQARMHQRVRDRLPHLHELADTANAQRRHWAQVLATAQTVPVGATFTASASGADAPTNGVDAPISGTTASTNDDSTDSTDSTDSAGEAGGRVGYLRTARVAESRRRKRAESGIGTIIVDRLDEQGHPVGCPQDATRREDEAFWTWAIIETLRHTGVRIEELLELTELALVSYRVPSSGEVVPLLQIVPSKTNEERLLLVSPEQASVFAAILSRLRAGTGRVPLIARYDHHERVEGPALPHLFQHRVGPTRDLVISRGTIRRLLNLTVEHAGLRDAMGAPLRFTPHDFRRIFATDAVTGGLPVHIAARLLGHHNLATTQAYLAVFQDDLIAAYRAYLERRRAQRPTGEYRDPTADEWREFEQHFEKRKLELGTCGRPYGTPCRHEHACIRCSMLRVDPRQRGRLVEIIANLRDRIAEAHANGWLGEVDGLQHSRDAAIRKLTALDRAQNGQIGAGTPSGRVDLGLPALPTPSRTQATAANSSPQAMRVPAAEQPDPSPSEVTS